MERKVTIQIIVCFALSITVIIGLLLFSQSNNKKENGFVRIFPPHLVGFAGKLDLKYNSYYIAGLTAQHIFLGNSPASTQIIVSNYGLTDTHHLALHVPMSNTVAWGAAIAHIDSPNIVLMEGIVPSILTGGFDTISPIHVPKSVGHFSKGLPVSGSSFILRVYDTSVRQNILTKYSTTLELGLSHSYKMEKQLDGVFCTDGMLLGNDEQHFETYVYYYRNEFIKLDTNLHLLFKGRTIDTISRAQLKVYTDSATMQSRMASPPLYVNKRSAVSAKWLFINSGLQASNEDKAAFTESSVIDIYSIIDGKYHFSFYLPVHQGRRLSSFAVRNNHLVAIYDDYLLSFVLNF